MTAKQMIDLIGELSANLKSAVDGNEEIGEGERAYLNGICAGLKLASDTIRGKMNEQ